MAILKFIFFAVVAIWFVGLILRATINVWFKKRTEEYNRAMRQAQREAQKRAKRTREGDVVIENTGTASGKKVSRSVGDYIEFEEIKDTAGEKR